MIIDSEFKALIPPLAPEELAQLEANILADGCRDPLVTWQGILIDGHNRFAICSKHGLEFEKVEMQFPDRESVMDWMDANQLGRRNLTPDAFRLALGRRYNRSKKTKAEAGAIGGASKDQIDTCLRSTAAKLATTYGVSEATVKRAGKFAEEVAAKPELQEAINALQPVKKVIKATKRAEAKKQLETAVQEISEAGHSDAYDVRNCSMADLIGSGVQIDCVISDPPYPKEFVHLYGELAESCAKAGITRVAVMAGQSYLPEIIAEMCKHLEYRWMIAYITPGGQAVQQWQAKVNAFWKPILVFGKSDDWIGDVATSKPNDNDKRFHGWGQSESGMSDLVSRLSKPGETVCDPFMGAGTTGVVSLALGRKFIGCDIDSDHCITSKARLEKTLNELKQCNK
jgi:site-specific DNA-methyltransferase (adenine-specific)